MLDCNGTWGGRVSLLMGKSDSRAKLSACSLCSMHTSPVDDAVLLPYLFWWPPCTALFSVLSANL